MPFAIFCHVPLVPKELTSLRNFRSSMSCHGPLLTAFHFFLPNFFTASRRRWSSSLDHFLLLPLLLRFLLRFDAIFFIIEGKHFNFLLRLFGSLVGSFLVFFGRLFQ